MGDEQPFVAHTAHIDLTVVFHLVVTEVVADESTVCRGQLDTIKIHQDIFDRSLALTTTPDSEPFVALEEIGE